MSDTQPRTQTCPSCGATVIQVPYDIGSGPEMSCASCEWCWGADGQDLQPLDLEAILAETRQVMGQRWAQS